MRVLCFTHIHILALRASPGSSFHLLPFPYLVGASLPDLLGPLIGFSGTGFTGCVQLECLTECFTLHTDLHEDAMAIRAARAFWGS